LESVSFGAVVPTGLASRPSFVDEELLSDEQVAELSRQKPSAGCNRPLRRP